MTPIPTEQNELKKNIILKIPAAQKSLEPRKKPLLLSVESWLVNDGILISWVYEIIPEYNWVGNVIPYITNNQPGALFFYCSLHFSQKGGFFVGLVVLSLLALRLPQRLLYRSRRQVGDIPVGMASWAWKKHRSSMLED